jgi:hypothetical protein
MNRAKSAVLLVVLVWALVCFAGAPAMAETVVEVWQGHFTHAVALSVNPTDGSCWVADAGNNQVVHLSASGEPLWGGGYFDEPASVSVNPTDGSCWVGQTGGLVHLSRNGTELWRGGEFSWVKSISVNPKDGSCWVAAYAAEGSCVVHLSEAGVELWRSPQGLPFTSPAAVSVNPSDGSCWVGAEWHILHLSAEGAVLLEGHPLVSRVTCVSVNSTDGSVWLGGFIGSTSAGFVMHMSASGNILASPGIDTSPTSLSANSVDGSCWIAAGWLLHMLPDSNIVYTFPNAGAYAVSVNVTDGSCWATFGYGSAVVQLAVLAHFSDVTYNHWAFHQIEACYAAGVVAGYPDGTYRPAWPVNRDQMAVYISRALAGGDANVPTGPASASFSDVAPDYWAYPYIEFAYAQKVVQGYPDGSYGPTIPVTRAQMAVFIARAVSPLADRPDLPSYYQPPVAPDFSDVPTDYWAFKYIEYCRSQGIVAGYADGSYRPEDVVTRDQMAVYIARAFELPL